MILFLYGKDTFRSRQQLRKMIEKFKADRDPGGYNVARLDASSEREPGRFMGEMLAAPFLAERRLVVIESLLSSKHAAIQEEILRRVEEKTFPESNIILFWEGTDAWKGSEAKTLGERLAKEKYAQRLDILAGAPLAGWAAAEIRERGGLIEPNAVTYLATHAPDTWAMSGLMDQLMSYRQKEAIRLEDVQLFLDEKIDENIFTLVEAIVSGQEKKIYPMLAEQYRRGEDVSYIFAMLLRQVRILLLMRDAFEREEGVTSDHLAKHLALHPFVVKKSLPLMKRFSFRDLSAIYDDLLKLDDDIKHGRGKPETLLDLFAARLSACRAD